MSVTVDHEPLPVGDLNLHTVGQVLTHLQAENRLVVQVLLDGEPPAPGQLAALRQTRLAGRTLFIETADPRELALEVLDEVVQQIHESEPLKNDAAELLQRNQPARALEKLGAVLRAWQNAHESVSKVTELLRIDVQSLYVEDRPLHEALAEFAAQLRAIKAALEQRDFVSLADILLYETADTSRRWLLTVEAVCEVIASLA